MRKYALEELSPGMTVGEPIYSERGQLIIDEGTVLTETLISRLSFYGINETAILEEDDLKAEEEPAQEEPVQKEPAQGNTNYLAYSQSQSAKIKRDPGFQKFQVDYTRGFSSLQSSFNNMLRFPNRPLDTEKLLEEAKGLMLAYSDNLNVFDMLNNMRQIDDSIYAHSLNVALVSHKLGKWLKLSEEDLKILTLCGLLHDVGKSALPPELLNKPGKYTDEEYAQIKKHPVLGLQMMQNQQLNVHIKKSILMHHERCDGSGYPQGLKQDQLDDFAMIVAIADVYDAMTAARSYRDPLCPFQVIAAFEKEGLNKYHPKYILTFLEHIANTYQHNRVMLNNGQSANIVMINKNRLTQPYIQFDDETIIDMSSHPELEIIAVL